MLDRYNELAMNYSDETADEMARLQDIIDGQNLWDLDAQVEQALQALNCPPPHASVTNLSGGEKRRVALTKPAAGAARHPAARRADQPSRRRDHRLAAALPRKLSGLRDPRHPRPLLPRQHHDMDAGARSRPGHPL